MEEWTKLMKEALAAGLTTEDIQNFLRRVTANGVSGPVSVHSMENSSVRKTELLQEERP